MRTILKKKSGKCVKFSKGKKGGKGRKGRKCLKRKCVSYTKRNSDSKKDRKGLKCLNRKGVKYEEEKEIQDKDISKQTATCSQSADNLRQKALSWLSKIKNLEKIRNGIKIENVRNESSSASQQFLATAKILGKFTKNGKSCSETVVNQFVMLRGSWPSVLRQRGMPATSPLMTSARIQREIPARMT